ncbi:MOXD1 homolog 2-like [Palaemon carinicauda]|uniref:MOXD1 homolog 2-like n=1 Tax=Palaemon carinicauda TaxID=392227 RepID=UPI0035B65658
MLIMENANPSSVSNPYHHLLANTSCFSCNHRHHHSHTNFRATERHRSGAMKSPPPPLPRKVPAAEGAEAAGGGEAVYIPLTSKVLLWLRSSSSNLWNITTTLTSFKAPLRLLRLLQTLIILSFLPNASSFASSSFITQRLTSYEQWTHEAWLEETGAFVVQWTPKEEHIEFRVTARTTGYIGFGLSSSPRMDGADIVVGWVHSGKAYLQDRHGKGNEEPAVDEQRDWMLVGGYENDTHTVLIMSRPYNTCDKQDHIISGLTLPSEAGYPLTPNGPKYYMMQAHYDNPDEHNFTDYSGIRIIYTPELRFYDAGVMSIGLDPSWKHQIPPRQRTVLSEGHCVGECTEAALPPTGINVFAVILHTHLLGRKVRVRHIRDGRELEPIAQDNNYDFNYQEYRALTNPRTVLPGDHLIGECTYNSRERTTITLGGFKTRDEMCLSFLFYWPKVDLSFCHSKPSLNTVLHALGIQELWPNSNPIKIRYPMELAGRTLEWRLLNYDWKNHFEYFQDATHTGTFNPTCWRRGESLIPEVEKLDYEYPNITEPWVAENVCRKRRRKNRRRKNKTARGRNHHLVGHGGEGDELEEEDGDTEEEVMFDDQMNSKPIETIDVDHYNHRDIFMPVMEEHFEDGIIDIYGVDTGHSAAPDRELQKEFQEMERDLEEEMHKKFPDTFQERTGHPNKNELDSNAPLNTSSLLAVVSALLVSLLTALYDGHG